MTQVPTAPKTGAEDVLWDLSIYYAGIDDPQLERDFEQLQNLVDDLVGRYHGRIADLDASEMAALYQAVEAIYEKIGRIGTYAYLNYATHSTDQKWGSFLQKVMEFNSAIEQKLVFLEVEWNALSDEQAQAILDDPAVAEYRYPLAKQRRFKPYMLSEPEERVLIEKGVTGRSAWLRLFNQIMAEMTFELRGEELNLSGILTRLQWGDREIRREAADKLTAALTDRQMELTMIFNVLAADKASNDRMRGYESWITERNLQNSAPDEVVAALIDAVTGQYELVARHYRVKRALMGVDELYDYDRYAPLELKDSDTFYNWDEARRIVLDAYSAFSPRMGEIAQQFFDHNWIHAPVQRGKQGGAFASYGTKETHPFVMLNYTGTPRDVMTLAHELGHGVHMYLAAEAQNTLNMDTPLTTAEMASVFGEMVVFQDLLARESDDEVRLSMLAHKLEDTFATVFRQISMNRFEDGMHNARRTEGELATERLSEIWMQTQRDMFQGSVTMRDEYANWWSYVPHFLRTPGYVYAYAFGELLVLALYRMYQEQGAEDFVPQYIGLLAAGGSDDPDRLLSRLGVDLNDVNFWQMGLQAIRELVEQEEALARRLYPDRF